MVFQRCEKKTLKTAAVIIILMIFIAMLIPTGVRAEGALTGDGSVSSPYYIRDLEDFKLLRTKVNSGEATDGQHYLLTADLDLSAEENWEAIGDKQGGKAFSGIFDGGGHVIFNLKADGETAGLFENLKGTVANLGVESGIVSGKTAGAIVSSSDSENATIINCYSRATVEGAETGGGIAGEFRGKIINSWYLGDGDTALCGSEAASLSYCYTDGILTPSGSVGSSETNAVLGKDEAASPSMAKRLNKNRYKRAVQRESKRYELRRWKYDESAGALGIEKSEFSLSPFEGTGAMGDPYLISSIEDLMRLRILVNNGMRFAGTWFKMTEDINLSSVSSWTPIGKFNSDNVFYGTFDGGGHVISNLTCAGTGNNGLFGMLGGKVINLGLEGGSVEGDCCGSIASHATGDALIMNCYSTVKVQGSTRGGGLADNFSSGSIVNSWYYDETGETPLCSYDAQNLYGCYSNTPLTTDTFTGKTENCGGISEADVKSGRLAELLNAGLMAAEVKFGLAGDASNPYYDIGIPKGTLREWRMEDGALKIDTEEGDGGPGILQRLLAAAVFAAAVLLLIWQRKRIGRFFAAHFGANRVYLRLKRGYYAERIYKWEWIVVGLLGAAALCCFCYDDLMARTFWTNKLTEALFGGNIGQLYEMTYAPQISGMTIRLSGNPWGLLPWAIWNLPAWAIMKLTGGSFMPGELGTALYLIWSCLYLVVCTVLSGVMVRKITTDLTGEKSRGTLAFFLLVSSILTFVAVGYAGQDDVVLVLVFLLALRRFIKGDKKGFLLLSMLSIYLKPFMLLCFFVVLLLKEKNILKILLKTAGVYLPGFLCTWVMTALESAAEGSAYVANMTMRRMSVQLFSSGISTSGASVTASFFAIILVAACVYSYMKKVRDEKELAETAVYLCAVVMAAFVMFAGDQYYRWFMMVPFLIIIIMKKKELLKINILLDTIAGAALMFWMMIKEGLYTYFQLDRVVGRSLFGAILNQGESMRGIVDTSGQLIKYYLPGSEAYIAALNGIAVACIGIMLLINSSWMTEKRLARIELNGNIRWMLWVRLCIIAVMIAAGVSVYLF